jgi:predicted nucleic acid-binding protein
MILLDTDVAIDILRGYPPAIAWLQGLGHSLLGLPGLVVMELLQGSRDKSEQTRVERFCQPYQLCWPSVADCQRALHDFAALRLSHGIGLLDVLIAHTAVGLNEGQSLADILVVQLRVIAFQLLPIRMKSDSLDDPSYREPQVADARLATHPGGIGSDSGKLNHLGNP